MPKLRLIILCATAFFASLFISLSLHRVSSLLDFLRFSTFGSAPLSRTPNPPTPMDSSSRGRYAFATFLTGPPEVEAAYARAIASLPSSPAVAFAAASAAAANLSSHLPLLSGVGDEEDQDENPYFISARVLLYSLLHRPLTASHANHSIPVLVLHTPFVPHPQLERLARDGATLVPVAPITADWIVRDVGSERWMGVLAKLRLWELEEYEKVCFVDADTLVLGQLDGVFADPVTSFSSTRSRGLDKMGGVRAFIEGDALTTLDPTREVEGEEEPSRPIPLPPSYLLAASADSWGTSEDLPLFSHLSEPLAPEPNSFNTADTKPTELNAGFFVLAPSRSLFTYYLALLRQDYGLFLPQFPEQSLLNFAHRPSGMMPWTRLGWRWNLNWATERDMEAGVRSLHGKFWVREGEDESVVRRWEVLRGEMEGFWRGAEDGRVSGSMGLA